MEIVETDDGTFLMNSKDLRAIQFLEEVTRAGVDSIKVEGRTKNEYYVALVARNYRKALDDVRDGKTFNPERLSELDKVASRQYFSGFLTRGMEDLVPLEEQNFQNYEVGHSFLQTQMYAGSIKKEMLNQILTFEIKNKIQIGDTIEVFSPNESTSRDFKVEELYYKGIRKDVLSGGMGEIQMKAPFPIPLHSILSVKRVPIQTKV
jgi:putative protease